MHQLWNILYNTIFVSSFDSTTQTEYDKIWSKQISSKQVYRDADTAYGYSHLGHFVQTLKWPRPV